MSNLLIYLLENFNFKNEMSIKKSDFEDIYGEKIETWINHVTKVIIYGNKSASWYEAIWKSGCNLCQKPFKHNNKFPTKKDILEDFIYAGFGKDEFKRNPLKAIEIRLKQEVPDIIDDYKERGEDKNLIMREVNWQKASQNIKNFIDKYIDIVLTRTEDYKLCYNLIDEFLAIPQI